MKHYIFYISQHNKDYLYCKMSIFLLIQHCRNILLNCVNVDLVEEAKQLGVGACDLNNSVQDANATKAHFKRGV
jgi:hypothetical protein